MGRLQTATQLLFSELSPTIDPERTPISLAAMATVGPLCEEGARVAVVADRPRSNTCTRDRAKASALNAERKRQIQVLQLVDYFEFVK
jgi:hypothetical protein